LLYARRRPVLESVKCVERWEYRKRRFTTGKEMLQEELQKKTQKPAKRRELVDFLRDAYRVATRRACQIVALSEPVYRYRSRRSPDTTLRQRIKGIAATRMRCGYQRIHVLLRREGWLANHKKLHRIYKEEGLNLRSKRPRRRVAAAHRMERPNLSST